MKADKACIDVAAGRAPADLVFKNVNVVNVFSEEIITADVAVAGGVIAGVGSYRGRTELDCTDKFLCPGFIDAHIHIESSLAAPFEFARAATRSGTTTIVADPHEIVNVCGAQAVQYLLDATENLPLNVYLMLPSSVPATPFETNGADFTAADMAPFMAHPRVLGLGEVMCYPDVLAARQTVLEKLALAADAGKRADGHAPGLSGRELQAYAAAGIRTEHECTTFAEAAEKLRAGLAVLVREGSAAKNLSVLVNGLLDSDLPADRFLFCTDDKHLDDIARDGHLRWNVRQAISLGMKPVTAIKMATWNAAREYGLRDLGAVAAGYRADLVLLDSLKQMTVRAVYKDGRPVEERFAGLAAAPVPDALLHSVHFENVAPADLALPVAGPAHVIEMVPYQIVTRHALEEVPSENGFFRPNAVYTKLCVVERHGKNGGVAVCPLKGYGIRLDSGDLAYLSKKAKAMLDAAGFTDAIISASNDLDEYLIDSLKIQGAAINSWGVGTNLITSKDCPSFGGVYKLAAILDRETGKFIPKIKLSENTEKVTNPGNKTIYRIYDRENHKIIADLICLADEVYDENKSLLLFDPIETWKKTHLSPGSYEMRELLVPVFKDGVCVYQSPKVMEIRDYCRRELDTLWDESRRLINPHEVHVDLSNELWHMKNQLLDSYHYNR